MHFDHWSGAQAGLWSLDPVSQESWHPRPGGEAVSSLGLNIGEAWLFGPWTAQTERSFFHWQKSMPRMIRTGGWRTDVGRGFTNSRRCLVSTFASHEPSENIQACICSTNPNERVKKQKQPSLTLHEGLCKAAGCFLHFMVTLHWRSCKPH